jgi:hypothetical protein
MGISPQLFRHALNQPEAQASVLFSGEKQKHPRLRFLKLRIFWVLQGVAFPTR